MFDWFVQGVPYHISIFCEFRKKKYFSSANRFTFYDKAL